MTADEERAIDALRTELDRVRESVSAIEQDVAVMKATAGRVRLTPGVGALLWGIFLGVIGLAMFTARLDEQSRINGRMMERMAAIVETHIAAPGHSVSFDRIQSLDKRIDVLEKNTHSRR